MEKRREEILFNSQSLPSNVFFSKKSFSLYVKAVAAKHVLVLQGKTAIKYDINEFLEKSFKQSKISFINYSEQTFFDELNNVYNKKIVPDLIISVGGGTIIDSAKLLLAMSFITENQDRLNLTSLPKFNSIDLFLNFIFQTFTKNPSLKCISKHIAIVTKTGSGAESSKTMIINSQSKKNIFSNKLLLPDSVFYFTKAYETLDQSSRTFSLFDSLTHIWESSGSPIRNELITFLGQTLASSLEDEKLFEKHQNFSFLGGLMQSDAGSGLTHALAHMIEQDNMSEHSKIIFFILPFSFIYWDLAGVEELYFLDIKTKIAALHSKTVTNLSQEDLKSFKELKLNFSGLSEKDFLNKLKSDVCARLTPKKLEDDLLLKAFEIFNKTLWN